MLVPLRYNDGSPVEQEKFVETRRELLHQFSGLTLDFVPVTGYWTGPAGAVVEDELVRLVVDVPDTPENRRFFVEWKEELKERFRQLDIWIVAIPLDIV
jgi:hypothetical protein